MGGGYKRFYLNKTAIGLGQKFNFPLSSTLNNTQNPNGPYSL